MTYSKKQYAWEWMMNRNTGERVWKTRILSQDYSSYNPEEQFLPYETSDYLNVKLKGVPYATLKTDDRQMMENVLYYGYVDVTGINWVPFFGYTKDSDFHAFLCPESAKIRTLEDVGILTEMLSSGDISKVGKYGNRLLAALPKEDPTIDRHGLVQFWGEPVWGKEVSWDDNQQISIVHLDIEGTDLTDDDKDLAIRYVNLKTLTDEQKALVDGCIVVSEKACRALGLTKDPREGMAWRGTFGTERGLGKGHILYKSEMSVDIVIYGPKAVLKTDCFYFGSMGALHVGVPHTDPQAFVNFGYHRDGLGVDLARQYMYRVLKASKDEQELRRLFLHHSSDPEDLGQNEWVLRRALRYGVSFMRFPGLYRRVVRYLMTKVMQAEEGVRIPMDTVAEYAYVLPDPNCIDPEGDIHVDRGIPEDGIVFPGIKPGTKVVCYRQPSENSNAWVSLKVVHDDRYQPFADRGICLLGKGASKVLRRLGGGDMDDQFVIVYDPKWVEAFHTLRPYPETEKLTDEVTVEELTADDTYHQKFAEQLEEEIKSGQSLRYSNRHVIWQMDMASQSRAGIGTVVNYGMIDFLLSDPDHKANMLEELQLAHPNEAGWLEEREPYQAAFLMTNLEKVIDAAVKDSSLYAKLGKPADQIKAFHEKCLVYPSCMEKRIPLKKVQAGGFVTANSLMCKALAKIQRMRMQLEAAFAEREWALVGPADKVFRPRYGVGEVPYEKEIAERVRGIYKRNEDTGMWELQESQHYPVLKLWQDLWREELAADHSHDDAYAPIVKQIQSELADCDTDMMERMSVELYYQLYKKSYSDPLLDDNGKPRTYPDSLLWSPVFGNHFINALRGGIERRGEVLCGYYAVAELRPEFRRRLLGDENRSKSIAVMVKGSSYPGTRNIYIQGKDTDEFNTMVGLVAIDEQEQVLINGMPRSQRVFRMDDGIIEFVRPQEICLPINIDIVGQKPLTRVYPKRLEAEAGQPGSFAKLLGKGLEILGLKKKE